MELTEKAKLARSIPSKKKPKKSTWCNGLCLSSDKKDDHAISRAEFFSRNRLYNRRIRNKVYKE